MEYGVLILGLIAIIAVVIMVIHKVDNSNAGLLLLKKELQSEIEADVLNLNTFLTNKLDALSEKLAMLRKLWADVDDEIKDLQASVDDIESNVADHDRSIDSHDDSIEGLSRKIEEVYANMHITVPPAPWIKEDYATYLENDAPLIKHLDSASYQIDEAIIFMAYMLQDLKEKVYDKTIVPEGQVETKKQNTRRKKVSATGNTNSVTTGGEPS